MTSYRQDLDVIKGFAIIAVVLFHMGLLKSGYLGVDAFFVINGFLIVPSILKHIHKSDFSYWDFMKKRIVRLLPLIVIASAVALGVGYFLMLPDDYENLSQSVIASNFFSENILEAITTKNYWDQGNGYKPLMQLWYVGILFEFYLLYPLLMMIANYTARKLKQSQTKWMIAVLSICSIGSLVLYLLPSVSTADKFYYIPFRFYELGIGGIAGYCLKEYGDIIQLKKTIRIVAEPLLYVMMCCSIISLIQGDSFNTTVVIGVPLSSDTGLPIPSQVALLLTVLLTVIVVVCKPWGGQNLLSKLVAAVGKMSYSIFIWHQVMLAFYRYSVSNDITLEFTIIYLIVVSLLSFASYYFIEKRISVSRQSFFGWAVAAILVILPSGFIYLHAGVVRDVPELDVYKVDVRRGMFAEYCDRVYSYKEFPAQNGKPNVLVEGVSFGRDFANIILESHYKDSVNLAYAFNWDEDGVEEKVRNSDYIFCFSAKEKIPSKVWDNMLPSCRIMGISTKNYGSCNGIIYKNRGTQGYFSQTNVLESGYKELNVEWKRQWGDNYIDLLTPAMTDSIHVRVFTDDNRFISQDCRHLTQAGAQWYARILDWKKIFEK